MDTTLNELEIEQTWKKIENISKQVLNLDKTLFGTFFSKKMHFFTTLNHSNNNSTHV